MSDQHRPAPESIEAVSAAKLVQDYALGRAVPQRRTLADEPRADMDQLMPTRRRADVIWQVSAVLVLCLVVAIAAAATLF